MQNTVSATTSTTENIIAICTDLMKEGATAASVGSIYGKTEQDMSKGKYKAFAPIIVGLQTDKSNLQKQLDEKKQLASNLQTEKSNLQNQLDEKKQLAVRLHQDIANLQQELHNCKIVASEAASETSRLQALSEQLQVTEQQLADSRKKEQANAEQLTIAKNELASQQQAANELRLLTEQLAEELSSLQATTEQAIIPNYIDSWIKRYAGEVETGNSIVTLINTIECVSIFACCMYIMPTIALGAICGTMMASLMWYAQSIIKNPKYIGASAEFLTVAFVVMCLSIATHYAAFYKQGGVIIDAIGIDITIVVSIVIPSLSFASLWLRQAQAQNQ